MKKTKTFAVQFCHILTISSVGLAYITGYKKIIEPCPCKIGP